MLTKPGVRGKLLKDGGVIDENIECTITIGKRSQYSSILDGHGEIETSKALPVFQHDLIMGNFEILRFDLILEDPVFEKLSPIPIILTDVEWKEKRWASFEIKPLKQ